MNFESCVNPILTRIYDTHLLSSYYATDAVEFGKRCYKMQVV